jgi:hypothetical protein
MNLLCLFDGGHTLRFSRMIFYKDSTSGEELLTLNQDYVADSSAEVKTD